MLRTRTGVIDLNLLHGSPILPVRGGVKHISGLIYWNNLTLCLGSLELSLLHVFPWCFDNIKYIVSPTIMSEGHNICKLAEMLLVNGDQYNFLWPEATTFEKLQNLFTTNKSKWSRSNHLLCSRKQYPKIHMLQWGKPYLNYQ